jgi:hypothetical protein
MQCVECGQTWSGWGPVCSPCVNNKLVQEQNELIERNQRLNSSSYYSSSSNSSSTDSPVANAIIYIVLGGLLLSPVLFPDTVVGKFFSVVWAIFSFPFILMFKLLGG